MNLANLPKGSCDFKVLGIKEFSPETAREVLNFSKDNKNRKVLKQRVWRYANDITKNSWLSTDGAILFFSKDNKLVDGQHRLSAVIEANKTVSFLVIQLNQSKDALGLVFNNCMTRTLSQITGEGKCYCNTIEFLHRIVAGYDWATSPNCVVSTTQKLEDKNIYDLVHRICSEKYHTKTRVPLWVRSAFTTAVLLGYKHIDKHWAALISENDYSDVLANKIWRLVHEAGEEPHFGQKEKRIYYFKLLLQLHNNNTTRTRCCERFKEEIKTYLRDFFGD